MIRLVCLLIGYIFGAFQTAFFYGKLHGIDIREHGSGNAGTTNTLRVLGTKAGIIVFAGDMIKSILAVSLVRILFKADYQDIMPLLVIYTGLGCVLGHNFPFYMHFKGGKGIATTGGLMIAAHYLYIPFGLVLFFGTLFLTHYASLGSLLLYLGFLVETVILGNIGIFGMTNSLLFEMYIVVFLMTVLAFYMHRKNIGRLLKGCESKTYLSKKKKAQAETKTV